MQVYFNLHLAKEINKNKLMSNRQWFMDYITFILIGNEKVDRIETLFGLRGEGVKGSKVEFVESRKILGQLYSILLQFKRTNKFKLK